MNISKAQINQKGLAPIIIILLIVVLILGFLVYSGKINLGYKTVLLNGPSPVPAISTDETANPDPIGENWKTYTSKTNTYIFKYPGNWPLLETNLLSKDQIEGIYFSPNPSSTSADNTIAVVETFKDGRIKSLDDYKRIFLYDYGKPSSSFVDLNETSVNGYKAISYTRIAGMPQLPIIEYVIINGDYYYSIRLVDSDETKKNRQLNIKIFEQMLSTFKFLDQ